MLTNNWKQELLSLINSENGLSLTDADIVFSLKETTDGKTKVTVSPAEGTPYFGERNIYYTKWDTEKFFLGVPLKIIVDADTTVKDVINKVSEKYQVTFDEAIDFTEEELAKAISFAEYGIQNIVVPVADTSYVWVGNLNLTVSNGTDDLANIIANALLDGLTYIDGIAHDKVKVQAGVLSYPSDFTPLYGTLSALKVDDKLSEEVAAKILKRINYVNTTELTAADLADGAIIFSGTSADSDYVRDGFTNATIVDYGDAGEKVVGKLRMHYNASDEQEDPENPDKPDEPEIDPRDLSRVITHNFSAQHGDVGYPLVNDSSMSRGGAIPKYAAIFLNDEGSDEIKNMKQQQLKEVAKYLIKPNLSTEDEALAKGAIDKATITYSIGGSNNNLPTVTVDIPASDDYDAYTAYYYWPQITNKASDVRPVGGFKATDMNGKDGLDYQKARIMLGCLDGNDALMTSLPIFIEKYFTSKNYQLAVRDDVVCEPGKELTGGIAASIPELDCVYTGTSKTTVDISGIYNGSFADMTEADYSKENASTLIFAWLRTKEASHASTDWYKHILYVALGQMSVAGMTADQSKYVNDLFTAQRDGYITAYKRAENSTEDTLTVSIGLSADGNYYDYMTCDPSLATSGHISIPAVKEALSIDVSKTVMESTSSLTPMDFTKLSDLTHAAYALNVVFTDNNRDKDGGTVEYPEKPAGVMFDYNNALVNGKKVDSYYSFKAGDKITNPVSDFPNVTINIVA